MAELPDDPPTDLLDHLGHIGIAGRLDLEKAGFAPLIWASEIDPLQKQEVEVEVQETLSTTPCRPP
jgi:hypothetical protein